MEKGRGKLQKNEKMKKWDILADRKSVEKTMSALKQNGIKSYFVKNKNDAKEKVFELLPEKAEIMNMTSVTLDETGIVEAVLNSEKYRHVRKKIEAMNRETQKREIQQIGAAPEWAIGSVHAVTEDGKILIASNTGSQLPAYAYGADKIIFVVGTQKIVKNLNDAMKRVYEHTLPLESERAKKAYGVEGSFISKILLINKEIKSERIHLIFVDEVLGY